MKIAVFYPRSLYSAWSVSEGIVDTLERMGHEVLNCGIDPQTTKLSRKDFPSVDELNACDLVLVSGPEHLRNFIIRLYPEWAKVSTKKVGWWHETVERSDYGRLPVEQINSAYDVCFTPAAQDEKYGMKWLPFGVDAGIFCGCLMCKGDADGHIGRQKRDRGAIFVGLLYGPRAEFVKKHGLQTLIKFGACKVEDLDGVNVRKSVELYASELRRSKILVNLPSLCRHAVTKISEGAACGAVVVTHKVEDERNHILKSGVFYESGDQLREILSSLLSDDSKREEIALAQCEEVHAHHRLDQRLETILSN
jgi:glycosyltransferase involved in cell wall biosynthesis